MSAAILTFVSGKGGTGNSTVCVFCGQALAALGKRVLYIELKFALRTADFIAGMAKHVVYDISDVMQNRCPLEKAVLEHPRQPGFYLLFSPFEDNLFGKRELTQLLSNCHNDYDYILIDAPAGLEEGFALATEAAHQAIFVLTPDPVSLRIGQLLANQPELEQKPQRMILNRVLPQRALAPGVLLDLDEAIDLAGVQLLGVIPDSSAIQVATTGGAVLQNHQLEARIFEAIAHRILGKHMPLLYT